MPFDRPTEREVLYTATRAQIGNILLHPLEKTLLAVTEVTNSVIMAINKQLGLPQTWAVCGEWDLHGGSPVFG